MLKLKLPTDPRWVNIVEENIPEILTDHAWCEQKAASNAISLTVNFPEYPDLVNAMLDLAQEELEHFKMVHEIIKKRNLNLGFERKDEYVNELYNFVRRGHKRNIVLVDKLLFSAMIEARSCERFRVLSENIKDKELAEFYHQLMISEANHYTLFIKFAKKYANGIDVDKRWQEFLDFEASIITKYGKKETVHG
ncbi:MAG: tRNA-(ms[2]io[6]A)-hydroxylase [Bacteroidia bacterium]|nr:tRNA-(ms[2]io[6]A)-hydroxylase [Bacteroidia bacterium]MCZ2249936.1 tRNA-(ms[2]io[6]A)-hydroxylase [Bacteroidia bacterium]